MNTESNGHSRGFPKIFTLAHLLLAFALGWACYWAFMPRPGRYVPMDRTWVLDTQTGHIYTDHGDWDCGNWPPSK